MSAVKRVSGVCLVSKKNTKNGEWNKFGLRSSKDEKVIESEKIAHSVEHAGRASKRRGAIPRTCGSTMGTPSVYAVIALQMATKKRGECCTTQLILEETD